MVLNPPYGARWAKSGPRTALSCAWRDADALLRGWQAGVFTGTRRWAESSACERIACTLLHGPMSAPAAIELTNQPEPDREQVRAERRSAARERPGAAMFANRLRKNLKTLDTWARREDVSSFRVYDADMPEYAFAIDLYGNDERHACMQEYEAPATVDAQAARARRDEALSVLEEVLALPFERVHLKTRRRQRAARSTRRRASRGSFTRSAKGGTAISSTSATISIPGCSWITADAPHHRCEAAGRRFLTCSPTRGPRRWVRRLAVPCRPRPSICRGPISTGPGAICRSMASRLPRTRSCRQIACTGEERQQRRSGNTASYSSTRPLAHVRNAAREFDVQHDHVELLSMIATCSTRGEIVFSNNYRRFKVDREGLAAFDVEDITTQTIPQDFARNPRITSASCCADSSLRVERPTTEFASRWWPRALNDADPAPDGSIRPKRDAANSGPVPSAPQMPHRFPGGRRCATNKVPSAEPAM